MPLYEYKCQRCGKTFEVRQNFSEAALSQHEGCGGELEKLLSAPSLRFKGTGWYVTDYGSGKNPPPEANGKPHAKKDSKSETKNSKSETKTESKPPESKPAPASSDK